jgi:hypothetical protein
VADIRLTATQLADELAGLGVEVKAFGRPDFDESEHPRDREGKFIEKGGTVRLRAGGTAEVIDTVGAGRIRVRRDDDGREVVLDAGLVTQTESANERHDRETQADVLARGGGDDPQPLGDSVTDVDGTRTRVGETPDDVTVDDDGEATRVGQPSLATDTVVGPGPGGASGGPMTDEEFRARAAYVEDVVGRAREAKLATEWTNSLDGKGKVWTRDRAVLHDEIVAEVMATAADVPNQGKAIFSGGMGGSGKTFTLSRPETGIDQSQYLTLNPDDIKEVMAARGMIPEVPDGPDLSPMERAALIHEESSHITQLIAHAAYAQRKNIIWDITMASQDSVQGRLTALSQARYVETKAVFVDISVEGSVGRAMSRYRNGQDRFNAGDGLGGRYVPPFVIRENASESFSSANRTSFESLRDQFDDWQVWDNSVDKRPPRLVYEKSSPNLAELAAIAREGLTDADRLELKSMPGTRAALHLALRRKGLRHSGQRPTPGGSRP